LPANNSSKSKPACCHASISDSMEPSRSDQETDSPNVAPAPSGPDRRDFLSTVSTVVMAGGLVAGYGTLVAMAGRYIFPSEVETPWLFVAEANSIRPGDSLAFESPTGVKIAIARRAANARRAAGAVERPAETDDFIALSSVCPHLGCRVHWESANQRFFCPCHNGVFDAQGKAISGPPKAADQELSRYPVKVERGLLYIAVTVESVGRPDGRAPRATAGRNSAPPEGFADRKELT
jgi:cytochrome b6-f complex iron-sulfur subunit